jgi:lipocalin
MNFDVGSAWVFTRSNGVWSQQGPKLVGSPTVVGNVFQGSSVSLSYDGNTAIVGGPSGAGATWVFTRSRGVWNQQAELVGTGAVGEANQGYSVALSADGNTAILGGRLDNNYAGAAWVFTRSATVWSQLQAKLVGTGAVGPFANQGYSVALSADGKTAILGGPSDDYDVGAAWVFARPVFAGTPGKANCHGKSVSTLARQFGGLNGAAAAVGYASVKALQDAIEEFCEG